MIMKKRKKWMTKAELMVMLQGHGLMSGDYELDMRQLFMWHQRRASNGFPEHEAIEERRRGVPAMVFDPDKVLRWRRRYVPRKGGRPPRLAA